MLVDALRRDGATVDVADWRAGAPVEAIWRAVASHGVTSAAVTAEPDAALVRDALLAAGVAVRPLDVGSAATADLIVTGVVAAIATTGSLVMAPPAPGIRDLTSLAAVHLCVVTLERIVATHAEVEPEPSGPLPTRRFVITGPDRSGAVDTHPLHVVVVR